jgi:glycosyltransferase involved in cell wall biosynthesis
VKVALTADPELAVPPKLYGGIERMVDMIATGLSRRGHDVVVFANAESQPSVRLAPWPGKSSSSLGDTVRNARMLAQEIRVGGFDIVHSFSRIAYLTPILGKPIPKIMSYQREITLRTVKLGLALARGSLSFTALGEAMLTRSRPPGDWSVIPNGVPLEKYTFRAAVAEDAPLVFLGRIEEIKGTHTAVEVAQRTGSALIIAGNIEPQHQQYFDQRVRPYLNDKITFVGPIDDVRKNEILGSARALLMPITWQEPFGIVMAEAMACGTPVLTLDYGAGPEVVQHGKTGFVCKSTQDMIDAVQNIGALDRQLSRARVENHYSDHAVVSQYEELYLSRLGRSDTLSSKT